jgi:hypothetical protein
VDRATSWLPAHKKGEEPEKYSPTQPISWIRENANRKSGARKRIQEALDGLKKFNRSFTTVELQEAAECARDTLYRLGESEAVTTGKVKRLAKSGTS